mmetsp:Transcript_9745/g.28275  ORF Transcript_9745/g.28275 Transcript_9745/m.28275 type:complete len:301 (+) Transcript_9745:915-1817(+)
MTAWNESDGDGVAPKHSLRCASAAPRRQRAKKNLSCWKAWSHHQLPDLALDFDSSAAALDSETTLRTASSAPASSSSSPRRTKRPADFLANASAIVVFPLPGNPQSKMARTPSMGSCRFRRPRTLKAVCCPASSCPITKSYLLRTKYSRTALNKSPLPGTGRGAGARGAADADEEEERVTSHTPACWNIFRRSGRTSSSTDGKVCTDWRCKSRSDADCVPVFRAFTARKRSKGSATAEAEASRKSTACMMAFGTGSTLMRPGAARGWFGTIVGPPANTAGCGFGGCCGITGPTGVSFGWR